MRSRSEGEIGAIVRRGARSSDEREERAGDRRAARSSDERARRSCPSSIAIVDRAARRTIAPISLLPRDLIFSSAVQSQFDQI